MTAKPFQLQPLSPACGAEVTGLDLPRAGDADMQAVFAALAAHGVLFFRGQSLTPEQQVAVTRRFGPVLRVPYIRHLDAHPDIIAVLKEADERRISTFGGTWHSDFSFLEEPPSLTLLYAIELPPVGGDTLWASQVAAYDALSPGMQRLLDPLRCVQTAWPHGTRGPGIDAPVSRSVGMVRGDPTADPQEDPADQIGLLGANPGSTHPLAGGSGPSVGAGMLRADSLPGAGGSPPRTPLLAEFLGRSDPAAAPTPSAATGGAAGSSTMGSGAAPLGAMGGGGHSSSTRSAPAIAQPLGREDDDEDEDEDPSDEDDW